ncbi:NblA/ycf18 family protein [Synechocystis salina LEGE 06155]|uniref:NblA/ycf18 family protein n=1 Tax=Synechocystis salina LEGE 00031 TaxID=1828736 RepID=A0ABR9VTT9_9SYNC|nr:MULTISPECIES: NblA/ycf18 family protein [Synechocystis]MBD2653535.1 NblA/ycf18 family protein [Synechocystis sp. FACHB-383]MBE9176358.1 NblA/ycf18 family protein [Synechocystis salina LEGE 06155]MBE9241474.1 NblA/ycf18 family protein [Synechocystis salina LEGE 00041]MBE9254775.1 NblA/ycf18 family protein [Synechocystis salina LEGE 00031]
MKPESFDLTIEQMFEFRRMQDAAADISQEQALELLVQASRLLMIKSNVIRDLMRQAPLEPLG